MIRLARTRKAELEPEDDLQLSPPAMGIHPLLDIMAMQWWIVRQQRDIWEHFVRVHRMQRFITVLMGTVTGIIVVINGVSLLRGWGW